jgi:hypothetical protein
MNRTLYIVSLVLISLLSGNPIVVSGGSQNDYEGWIGRINDGRLMVIFCRNPDWSSGDLYITFSTDNGSTWDERIPIIIEFGDQATLSFAQLPFDTLRVWYASNEGGEYGIYSAHSMDGLTWVREGWLDIGWSMSDMFYDPTVIIESDSSVTMSYRGPGGAYITHKPHQEDWDTLRTLVGSGGYRPRVMKHTNGTYLYAYHRNIGGGQYEVFVRTSPDRITWSNEVQLTFSGNSHDPFPNQTPDGAYLVYYATYAAPAYNLHRRRSYDAVNWEPDEQITSSLTNNTQPHFFIENNTIYLLWAHCVSYPYDHDVYFEPFIYVGVDELHIVDRDTPSLMVTPSICSDECLVSLYGPAAGTITAELYDVQGRAIKNWSTGGGAAFHLMVDDLKEGVYVIRCTSTQGAYNAKLVVVR